MWSNPSAYYWDPSVGPSGTIMERPLLTIGASGTTWIGTLALTASAPSWPSTGTITVGDAQCTVPLTSGTFGWPVTLHPTLQGVNLIATAQVGLSAPTPFEIGTATGPPLSTPVQILPSGNGYWITPTSATYLRGFYQGVLSSIDVVTSLTRAFQNLYVSDSIFYHLICQRILPYLMSGTDPLTLSADEAHALQDLQQNFVPTLNLTLETIFPSGGDRLPLYQDILAQAPSVEAAAQAYQHDLETIPNLGP